MVAVGKDLRRPDDFPNRIALLRTRLLIELGLVSKDETVLERSVTGGSVEGDSKRLVGPAARGEVVWPTGRDRASSYAQSGGARRGTHPT